MYVMMSGQPPIMLGLMSIEVIQNDMQLRIRVTGNDVVHEVQELPTSATGVMGSSHQSC
jgi:hypothetical protein